MMDIKRALPWWLKIGLKLMLSRLPVSYTGWRRLGIFKHGAMERPDYAFDVFKQHFTHAAVLPSARGLSCLELGPGDSLFGALIARAHGAGKTYLVDSGDYACRNIAPYLDMMRYLADKGLVIDQVDTALGVQDLLRSQGGIYLVDGLDSIKQIPTASVDFIWSQAVLEHIRRKDFVETMGELRRVINDTGVCSHRVDLQDHLDNALYNLRFRRTLWESEWMARSGFYTNRIRYREMLRIFEEAGFRVSVEHVDRWDALPTPRESLDCEFRDLDEQDLLVAGFNVALQPC